MTVVGAPAAITAGGFVQASGGWVNDRTHGVQFKVAFLRAAPPTMLEGIERYLGSGLIKGIGPAYGRRLVQAFGEAVFDVIQRAPGRLPRAVQRRDMPWANAESARIVRSAKRIAAQRRNPIRLAPFRPRARRW